MQVNLLRKCSSTLLGPSLRVGDVVVLANLAAHKVQGVREALGESGATLLYLPPYSPDFNPIEQAYAKLKALLRKAAARTVDGLESAIATVLEAFSPVVDIGRFVAFVAKSLDDLLLVAQRHDGFELVGNNRNSKAWRN